MNRREELTEEIAAVDDAGNGATFYVYTTLVAHRAVADGITNWARGSKRMATADGGHVNPNADGTFTVLDTGRKYRRKE